MSPMLTRRAVEAATVTEAFRITVERHPDVVALRRPGEDGITWREYGERVRRAAEVLHVLGVRRGDTVGLMLVNRPEFHWWDAAAMHLGATAFSLYTTLAPEQISYVVQDAGAKVLITERRFAHLLLDLHGVQHLLVLDDDEEQLDRLRDPGFDFEAAADDVEPDDVLTLIYTSGTTGPPKGVQLTHHNVMTEVRAMEGLVPDREGDLRVASYLPMAHIAERSFSHYQMIPRAGTVTCVDDAAAVIGHLPDIRPTAFVGMPRVWEKVKAGLETRLPAPPQDLPQDVRRAIREHLGFGELEAAYVGAAPTPVEVLEFFDALGVEILEVWGMSETTAVATANLPGARRVGSVGRPLPGVEVALAEDGEVLVRGDIVMPGYRNLPEQTDEALDEEGWLHTGDMGRFDDDGFLSIVDRKKELIINASGKNMSPANIEARLKSSSPLIGQAVCIGDARPYNTALIVLEPEHAHAATDEAIAEAIDRANAQLSRVEQIKRWTVLREEWLPGGDELTPTMKLKRRPIAEKHRARIEAMYR